MYNGTYAWIKVIKTRIIKNLKEILYYEEEPK